MSIAEPLSFFFVITLLRRTVPKSLYWGKNTKCSWNYIEFTYFIAVQFCSRLNVIADKCKDHTSIIASSSTVRRRAAPCWEGSDLVLWSPDVQHNFLHMRIPPNMIFFWCSLVHTWTQQMGWQTGLIKIEQPQNRTKAATDFKTGFVLRRFICIEWLAIDLQDSICWYICWYMLMLWFICKSTRPCTSQLNTD